MKAVEIYTDGACSGNPGAGGYGVVLLYGSARKELSEGYRLTTNNRMEVLAVIKGLEALKEPCQVTLYSDSKYVVDAIQKGWVKKWKANGWYRNKKEKASNVDLWERLLVQLERHQVTFQWVIQEMNAVMNWQEVPLRQAICWRTKIIKCPEILAFLVVQCNINENSEGEI